MGTSAEILKEREKYCPEKLLADAIVAAFHADVMLTYNDNKNFRDKKFMYVTLNILDHSYNPQFILYVKGKDNPSLSFDDHDYEYYGLDSSRKLCSPAFVEEIYGAEEILFRFIYEYLKINPDDYFCVDDYNWVYRWEDMQKLKSLPYDPDWCYKDPRMIK